MAPKRQWLPIALFAWITILAACTTQRPVHHATLYRDDFGVPHIYAETIAAGMYAHGYAQAEDRLEQVLKHYRWAEGTLAEVFGKTYLESDYRARVWRHADISRSRYQELSEQTRTILEAFVAGIKAYMKEHPEKVPDWAPEIQPWHPVALARAFIWPWPEGQARDDLNRKKPGRKKDKRGSNQWALAGSKTASGKPILLIDPHLSWESSGKWTEVRFHAENLHMAGMVIPGLPLIALGHNRKLAWAATTGGPDCGDIYAIETDPANPLRYRYDNEWRSMRVDSFLIRYKEDGRIREIVKRVERSHHGPIVRREGRIAYAMAIPYEHEVHLVDTMLDICLAESVQEFQKALSSRQFLPQNMMAADVHGNIYYQRTGRVPIRPQGYDFRYPVPGNTSKTEWLGLHPTSDLVQILNPPAGYMQNCNISPGTMIHEGAPEADAYPAYIFNDRPGRSNPRGRRAIALLKDATAVDIQKAMRIAFDTTLDGTDIVPWQQALKSAYEAADTARFADLKKAVRLIVDWNREVSKENRAAALYFAWREQLRQQGNVRLQEIRLSDGRLRPAQRRAMLSALRQAVAQMQQTYGRIDIPWGTIMRHRRGDKDLPLAGTGSTLRSIWGKKLKDGTITATGGQSCPMLVHLTQPIESYSVLPYGISDDPASPHYFDQMGLFSNMQMKPTYFNRKDLYGHITDQKEFRLPQDR